MRLWAVLLVVLAGPAAADDYIAFQSPTGNIHCGLYVGEGQASVRCDLRDLVPSYTSPPPGCEFDWGSSFGLDSRGKGYLACASDAVADPVNPVLGYGQAVSLGGISCVSAKNGMTCTNAEGHGFQIARAKQRLY
jgi:hypothetical protein